MNNIIDILHALIKTHIKEELKISSQTCNGCSVELAKKMINCESCRNEDVITSGCESCKDTYKKITCKICRAYLRSEVFIIDFDEALSLIIKTLLPAVQITRINWGTVVPPGYVKIINNHSITSGAKNPKLSRIIKKITQPNSDIEMISEVLHDFIDNLCRFAALVVLESSHRVSTAHLNIYLKYNSIYLS